MHAPVRAGQVRVRNTAEWLPCLLARLSQCATTSDLQLQSKMSWPIGPRERSSFLLRHHFLASRRQRRKYPPDWAAATAATISRSASDTLSTPIGHKRAIG